MKYGELLVLGQSGIYTYNTTQRTVALIKTGNYITCGKDKCNYIALRTDGNIYTSKTGYVWHRHGLAHSTMVSSKIECNEQLTYLGPMCSPSFTGYNTCDYCNWSRGIENDISDVAWNGKIWLAGGESLHTSPDGKVWKPVTLLDLGGGTPQHINKILWDTKQWIISGIGTGIFVVNDSVMTSLRTLPPQENGVYQGALFFNFSAPIRYMAGQYNRDETVPVINPLIRSENAIQWTTCNLGVSNITKVCDITYKDLKYHVIAKSTDGKTHLFSSVNGIEWTHVSDSLPMLTYFLM